MDHNGLLYLDNPAVLSALAEVDELAVVRDALLRHAAGEVTLPKEAVLRWPAGPGEEARSLALPASLEGDPRRAGLKVINANPANPRRGEPRASGLLLLFDPSSARIRCVMQAEHVSSHRTAAVSALALLAFASGATSMAVIGAGPLAEAHLRRCGSVLEALTDVRVFDREPERSAALTARGRELLRPQASIRAAGSAEEAVRGADVVIPVTTTSEPYIEHDWLAPEATVVNVSLDDCHAEVFERAALLVVDDWSLVEHDDQRLLGRLARAGRVSGPGRIGAPGGRPVDGELGSYLAREIVRPAGLCVVNPFGMGITDVALGAAVHERAAALGLGVQLRA